MARRKSLSRRRIGTIGIGTVLLIFLVAVSFSGGEDLFLGNPFADDLNFSELTGVFRQFSIVDVDTTELQKFIKGDKFEILGKNCFTKLRTDVELKNGQVVALNSRQQFFSELTTFALRTTTTGTDIESFFTDLRVNCDLIEAIDGTRLPFIISAPATQPIFLSIWALDENGVNRQLKQNNISLPSGVVFDDSGEPDPLEPSQNLFIGSERSVTKRFEVSAQEIENLIGGDTSFTSRIQFRISGGIDYDNPFLKTKIPNTFPIRHGLDQGLLINSFDFKVVKPPKDPDIFGTERNSEITSIVIGSGVTNNLKTDGSSSRSLVRAFASLDNYDTNEEGVVVGFIQRQFSSGSVQSFIEASTTCTNVGTDGIKDNFECRFSVRNDIDVGTYLISVRTNFSERQTAFTTFQAIREGAPVGTGCPEGQVPDPIGGCQLFGSETFRCDEGLERNVEGICVVPEVGNDPCEQGEFRDRFGSCSPIIGEGGIGTKSCASCEGNTIRVVAQDDICPVFMCDGFNTDPDGIPNCSDKKPADILPQGGTTCDRIIGTLGGLLPILVDCEGEGREANVAQGEVCAPAIIISILDNLVTIIIVVIFLIVLIAILGFIFKRSPAGILARGFRS